MAGRRRDQTVPDIESALCQACQTPFNGVASTPCCGMICEPCVIMCFNSHMHAAIIAAHPIKCPSCRMSMDDAYVGNLVVPELFLAYRYYRAHPTAGHPVPIRDSRTHICPECGDDISVEAREVAAASNNVDEAVADAVQLARSTLDEVVEAASTALALANGDVWTAVDKFVDGDTCHVGRRHAAVPISCPSCHEESCFSCGWAWESHDGMHCEAFLSMYRADPGAPISGPLGKNFEFYFGFHPDKYERDVPRIAMLRKRDIHNAKLESDLWEALSTRRCPVCATSTEKNGGCLHMACTRCGSNYCWECHALNGVGSPGESCTHGVYFSV